MKFLTTKPLCLSICNFTNDEHFWYVIWYLQTKSNWETLKNFYFETRLFVSFRDFNFCELKNFHKLYFFSIPNLSRCKILLQNLTHNKVFYSKLCSLKKHKKSKSCRFWRVNWTKTWLFESKLFFKVWHLEKIQFKLQRVVKIWIKIWRFVKFFKWTQTRWKNSKSNYDKLWNFNSNSDTLYSLPLKSDFYLVFQVLIEWWYLLSKLKSTEFEGEKWKTMSVIDLVTSCTSESCHTSTRFAICGEKRYNNR